MDRNNSFDLIRFLAATAVLFEHCYVLSGPGNINPVSLFIKYDTLGGIAVDTFFILSGFLVTRSYLNSDSCITFTLKRVLRIFPGLLCVVLACAFVAGPALTTLSVSQYYTHPETYSFLLNAVLDTRYYLPGIFNTNPYPNAVNGSLWTLPIEVTMYLLVLILGICKLLSPRGCGLLILAFAWLYFTPPQTMPEISFLQQLLPYNNWFKLGILFFGGALFSFSPQPPTINIDLLIVALLALTIFPNSSISQIVIFLTLPYLVITISSTKSRASAVLSRMGDFSYGLYIYAFPVQQTVASILLDSSTPLKIFAYSFPITLFFAVISWHFVEKPCISLKRFLPTFKNTPLKTSSNIN